MRLIRNVLSRDIKTMRGYAICFYINYLSTFLIALMEIPTPLTRCVMTTFYLGPGSTPPRYMVMTQKLTLVLVERTPDKKKRELYYTPEKAS